MTPLHQRLVFDLEAGEIRDADRRYLLMRPDVLMGALSRLDAQDRSRVLQAFADSAAANGANSVRAYLDENPGRLLDIMRTSAAALGWGDWKFESSTLSLRLTVRNSPFAHGYGPSDEPVCAPIAGMLRSVAEHLLGGQVEVTETACATQGRESACRFVAARG